MPKVISTDTQYGARILGTIVQAVTTGGLSLRSSVGNVRAILSNSGLTVGNAEQTGSGVIVLGLQNAGTVPSTNPSDGVILYSEAGVAKIRQQNGAIVTVANVPGVNPPVTLTDAATVDTNASLANHFRVTLGGNRTLGNPTNPTDGQKVTWEFIQDGTGSRTITLGSAFALGTDLTAVTLSTAAGKRDFMGAIYNSSTSKWYVVSLIKGY